MGRLDCRLSDGTQGLYVAEYVNGTWTGIRRQRHQCRPVASRQLRRRIPSIADHRRRRRSSHGHRPPPPDTAIEVATYSATANGGAGGWVGLGNSYSATGISGVGDFDNAQIVETSFRTRW